MWYVYELTEDTVDYKTWKKRSCGFVRESLAKDWKRDLERENPGAEYNVVQVTGKPEDIIQECFIPF